MVFMATNREIRPDTFGGNRNPHGVTWWSCPGKPFGQAIFWQQSDQASILALIASTGKPVVVFIHGYNESWERLMGLAQSVYDALGDAFTLLFFSWDSLGNIAAYAQDIFRAQQSAHDLLDVLASMNAPSVIAHSMGNYLLETALDRAGQPGPGNTFYVRNLAMVAADVPFDVLKTSKLAAYSLYGLVMYSPRDVVLGASSELHVAVPRLGLFGPIGGCPPNFTAVNCFGKMPWDVLPTDIHGYYFRSKDCCDLMRTAMNHGLAAAG